MGDRKTCKFHTANLGDSGFLVIRDNQIVHKSEPQCHMFNAPFQLSLTPKNLKVGGRTFNDKPQHSDYSNFQCEEGDVIVLASDGLFDNVHLPHIQEMLNILNINQDLIEGSKVCNYEASPRNSTSRTRNSDSIDNGFHEDQTNLSFMPNLDSKVIIDESKIIP